MGFLDMLKGKAKKQAINKISEAVVEPSATTTAPVLKLNDIWCKMDKKSGVFAIVDRRMNTIWSKGLSSIPKWVKPGRYEGKDLDKLNIKILDQSRWVSIIDSCHNRNGTVVVDIVEIKQERVENEKA